MKRIVAVFCALLTFLAIPLRVNAYPGVYHKCNSGEMKIALTFDDGPHPINTPKILDILSTYGIKATFFEIGENVGYYTEVSRRVLEEGHEIGNHTFSHPNMSKEKTNLAAEIKKCEDAIENHLGYKSHLFRPPEGVVDASIKDAACKSGYNVILWSIDTRDWAKTPKNTIISEVMKNIHPGAIILMHDYTGKDCHTVEALDELIPKLIAQGYSFVTVSELLGV